MKIINFEEAKAKRHSKERAANHLPEVSDEEMELQKQDQELARFYSSWYDEHVVGQDENGRWIYKNI